MAVTIYEIGGWVLAGLAREGLYFESYFHLYDEEFI